MKYNFDTIYNREGTSTYKYGKCKFYFGKDDILPLWVADMDFASPDFVIDAISERLKHPVLGYTLTDDAFYSSMINWFNERHQWQIEKDWIRHIPGVVPGLVFSMLSLTEPDDKVIVQPPIYPPFLITVKQNKRKLVCNELLERSGTYEMNLEELEQFAKDGAKMLFLCSPHNPGGMVWSRETLEKVSDIADKYSLVVVSDEIHADLVLDGSKHIPYAQINEKAKNHSITLVAPSKTFNIAGLGMATAVIPNVKLRQKFLRLVDSLQAAGGHVIGFEALKAAYNNGNEWLDELLEYLKGNVDYIINFLNKNIPEIVAMPPQASFLIWLDCKKLNLSDSELKDFLVNKAKLGFNHGPTFGPGGEGFQRINIGAPRSILEEAMKRLYRAYVQEFKKNI